jgi:hypothetical protein
VSNLCISSLLRKGGFLCLKEPRDPSAPRQRGAVKAPVVKQLTNGIRDWRKQKTAKDLPYFQIPERVRQCLPSAQHKRSML